MVVVFTIHPCTPSARVFADLIRIPFTWHIINETHRIVKQELPIYSASPNYENRNEGGWIHLFGIGYDLSIASLLENGAEQDLHLSVDIAYNDGTGANCNAQANTGVDHDWSHAVFGISTDFKLSDDLTFAPGIYYQVSMDDSVNASDEYWLRLGLTYRY